MADDDAIFASGVIQASQAAPGLRPPARGATSVATPQGGDPQPEGAENEGHPFAVAGDDRYVTRALLGQGGMGRVELVIDQRLRREVALKAPRADATEGARLAQEAWIAAQLEHPGIVPVYDAGRRPDGSLFYTMRVIRGRSLEEALAAPEARGPSTAALQARLGYLRHYFTATEAVAYAHTHGIAHRDLKPQNILVGELGQTQVADWGVACPIEGAVGASWADAIIPEDHAVQTMVGGIVGTPAYMSPEQAAGAPANPRADVWSLGAILYRILSDAPPFPGASASEVLTRVRTGVVPPLPQALSERGAAIPRELAAIAHRALMRDPAARYPDAKHLAADVASYLDGRRVSAHVYSSFELLKRLVSAWRVPLIVAGLAAVVLIVGGIYAAMQIVQERDHALAAERTTAVALAQADDSLAQALFAQAEREAERGQLPEAELLAAEALVLADSPAARGLLASAARPAPSAAAVTPWAACGSRVVAPDGASALCMDEELAMQAPAERWRIPLRARVAAFQADDTLLVSDHAHALHRLRAHDGGELGVIPIGRAHGLSAGAGWGAAFWGWAAIVIDPDGKVSAQLPICALNVAIRGMLFERRAGRIQAIVACNDGVFAWADLPAHATDAIAWHPVPTALAGGEVGGILARSHDEARLAVLDDKGRLAILDWPSGALIVKGDLGLRGALALAFAPDDRRLAGASRHGAARVVDAATLTELARLPRSAAGDVRWEGKELVTLGASRIRWTLPDPPAQVVLGAAVGAGDDPADTLTPGIASFARAPNGDVALGRGQGRIDVLRADGTPVHGLDLERQAIKALGFTADGGRLWVAGAASHALVAYRTDTWEPVAQAGACNYRRLGVLAGDRLVAASWSCKPELFGPAGERLAGGDAASAAGGGAAFDLDVAPDRSWAVLLEEGSGRVSVTRELTFATVAVMIGATAVAASQGELAVVDASAVEVHALDGTLAARFATRAPTLDLAFIPGSEALALAGVDGTIRIQARDGKLVAELRGHRERVAQLIATPEALWSASWDGTSRRWGWGPLTAPADQLVQAARTRWALTRAEVLGPL